MDNTIKIVGLFPPRMKLIDDLTRLGLKNVVDVSDYVFVQSFGQLPLPFYRFVNKPSSRDYHHIPPKKLVCGGRGRKFRRS